MKLRRNLRTVLLQISVNFQSSSFIIAGFISKKESAISGGFPPYGLHAHQQQNIISSYKTRSQKTEAILFNRHLLYRR